MYKARIGRYYEELKTTATLEYLMSPAVRERFVIKVNEDFMIDIDNHDFYSIVKRNKRGYIESDIELNKEYAISYEPVKINDFETYRKCANAKIYAILFNHYQNQLNKIKKTTEKEKIKQLKK